jgi:hypothetical protein
MRTLSYRLDASLSTVRAGYTAQTSPIDQAPAGYWFSGSAGSSTVNLGDIGLFAGTGLLLGSAGIGFRSVRTVQMPHRSDTFIEPWKSRYRTPALRGIGVRTSIDSGAVTLGLVAGRSLSDAVTSYVAMAALHDPAYSLGVNVVLREPLSSVSGSCWFRSTSKARTFCAEIACTSQGLPAMQASYELRSPLISIGLSAWLCTDSIELPHGSLSAVSTRPRNTLGVAFSAGQTIRSLVGLEHLVTAEAIDIANQRCPLPRIGNIM